MKTQEKLTPEQCRTSASSAPGSPAKAFPLPESAVAFELVKLFCNTYKEKFRQDHACILFSNGVIYPLDECGRI